jgi:hypothetical protein
MSLLVPPPPVTPGPDSSGGDGLDRLLRAFFRAELPDPWPAFEAPADEPPALLPLRPAGRASLFRSRLALAASVALLLAGPWMLAGRFGHERHAAPGVGPFDGNARREKLPDPRPHMFIEQPREGSSELRFDFYPDSVPGPR